MTEAEKKRTHSYFRYQERMAYIFIAAPMLLFLIFTVIPIVSNFVLAFTNYSVLGETKFVGLRNYTRVLTDELFWKYLLNTIRYTVMYVPACFLFALCAALMLNRRRRGVSFFRICFYLPVLSSAVASSAIWLWLLNSQKGIINSLLRTFGLPGPAWLQDTRFAMFAIILMSVWGGFGSNMMIFLAGLQGVPDYLYESARLDGTNRFQEFIYVTIPSLGPTIFFIITNLIIGSMQMFDQAYTLTQGGPGGSTRTLVYYIYESGFANMRMGYASAMSIVLFLIIMLVSFVNIKINNSSGELI